MYDIEVIQSCASGLVGWHESNNPCYEQLSDILRSSFSNIYVDDLPGIEFAVIQHTLSDDWSGIDSYLQQVHNSEIANLVSKIINNAKQQLKSKELLSNFQPVAGRANFGDLMTKDSRFVGWVITPHQSNNLRAEINYLGMQLDTPQTLTIYLYETSQNHAIRTFSFTTTEEFSLQWERVSNFICNYQSTSRGQGQQYLLGYYEDDLTGQALTMEYDYDCCSKSKKLFNRWITVKPIALPSSKFRTSGSEYLLPDTENLCNYESTRTYGLVLKMNITCDVSNVICENIMMLAKPLQYMIAIRVLWDAIGTTKLTAIADSGKNIENWKNFALKYEGQLYGYPLEGGKWVKGLIDNITIDFSNIDRVCLPCKQDGLLVGRISR